MLETLKAMPMKGKITLAGSALGVIVVAFLLMQLATKPSYELVMSGIEDLMSKQKLGTSDFQQKITYQRALEGEIAKTIDQVAGSGGARVQLSLPGDQLFADEEKPATASVLLGAGSENIEPAQVRGIASLVAGAVEGLKKDEVTITDSSGNMLWPQGDGSDTGATMTK